ncbi:Bifunctional coenzyme A synthase [Blattella germanica]|nr:Bifunctional coenzyme A synthase [Blattella germanica]
MAKIGLLVLTNPTKLGRILPVIKQHVNKILYVQVCPERRLLSPPASGDTVLNGLHHSPTVIGIYSLTSALCQNLDVRVLLASLKDPLITTIHTRKPVEVVIFDHVFNNEEVDHFVQSCLLNAIPKCQVVTLDASEDSPSDNNTQMPSLTNKIAESLSNGKHSSPKKYNKMHENVVLGGTFDRLHTGHKILLSEAVLRCTRKLTVGVTDTIMLKCKVHLVFIYFLLRKLNLQYPQLIVVSAETYKGGLKVNEIRQKNNLSSLEIHAVDLLSAIPEQIGEEEEEEKISSSNRRMRLLGTRLKNPEVSSLPNKPYIVGLTGSTASGKSSVAQRLEKLGAGVVNCDLLAHVVYKKGEPCYNLIVKEFGNEILGDDGEINRKALGAIVFNSKEKLELLNSLVWPALLDRAKQEIKSLYQSGRQVVILDAAILLQAGWEKEVHEIWTCIISPDEAVRRLQDRNSLSESEAKSRVASLPSNSDFLAKSHVVFCTFWSPKYTQKQVEKAWRVLELNPEENSKL